MLNPNTKTLKTPETQIIIPSCTVFKKIESKVKLRKDVILSINNRESLIKRLRKFQEEKSLEHNAVRISRILFGLHNATLCAAETIAVWMRIFPQSCPLIYNGEVVFDDFSKIRGQHYLLKMLTDLCFVNSVHVFKKVIDRELVLLRNPFILKMNVDQIIKEPIQCHLPSKNYNTQLAPNNNFTYFLDWKVDIIRVRGACFQILTVEKNLYGKYTTFRLSHGNRTDENDVRYICNSKVPLPSLDEEELYRLVNMNNPPLAVALVISCSRLILGCNDDIVQNIHYFSRSLVEELLHQPISILLNKLYTLKKHKLSVTMRTLHLVHPIIMHKNLSPVILENELGISISNLAGWTQSIVETLLNEDSTIEEAGTKGKAVNSKCKRHDDTQDRYNFREGNNNDGLHLFRQNNSTHGQFVSRTTTISDRQEDSMEGKCLVLQKPEIETVEEALELISNCERKRINKKKRRKRKKTQMLAPLPRSNFNSMKTVSDNLELNVDRTVDGCNLSHDEGFDDVCLINLVPVPLSCLIQVEECTRSVKILKGSCNNLSKGTQIRIGHAHFSSNWMIDSATNNLFNGKAFNLTKPYDHSRILEKKMFLKNDPLLRLHDPYSKMKVAGNNDSENNITLEQDKKTEKIINSLIQDGNMNDSSFLLEKRQPLKLSDMRVWKLIPRKDDSRPEWRIQYDNQDVPWRRILKSNVSSGTHFRVQLDINTIEEQCLDSYYHDLSANQQRLHYFEKVPMGLIIEETFNTVCCWHPISNHVDNVKWAKLSRKMMFLSDEKNSNHEIDMAFIRHSHDRKLDLLAFEEILKYIAQIENIHRNKEDSLFDLLYRTVVVLPSVNKMMWLRAQEMAVSVQALRVSAQIRISAFIRKHLILTLHRKKIDAATFLSKQFRSMISCGRRKRAINQLKFDRLFRLLFLNAMKCQAIWRCYCWRKNFLEYKQIIRDTERKKNVEYRKQLKAKSNIKKLSLVYRKTKSIQSVKTISSIFLHDKYHIDSGTFVQMDVYIPETQKTFQFKLTENEVSKYLVEALGCNGPISWNEMLRTEVIALLVDRLMCRRLCNRPIILFCKRDLAINGKLLQKKTWKFEDNLFVLLVYQSSCDTAIRAYDPNTSKVLTFRKSHQDLNRLIEESTSKTNVKYKQFGTPSRDINTVNKKCDNLVCSHDQHDVSQWIETFSNRYNHGQDLIEWLIPRLYIKHDNLQGDHLILLYETKKDKEERFAIKIQSIYRRVQAKGRAKKQIIEKYEKVYDRASNSFFYANVFTGRHQWEKPFLLDDDDIKEPENEWKASVYTDEITKEEKLFYINKFTGQSSWLSESDAARLIQKKYRKKLNMDLLGPKLDFSLVARAVNFIRDTKESFTRDGSKLSNKVNFALYSHCLLLDFDSARKLYKESILKGPGHPVITRAYGIFLLASCETPFLPAFQKATKLFKDAEVVDPEMKMFKSAIDNFFYWGVLTQPQRVESLLNYALIHQCIIGDFERADDIYRRAFSVDPTNTCLVQNFNHFLDQTYPGGYYAGDGPPYSIVHRSSTSDYCDEWSEWKKMLDPMCQRKGFEYFWYNPLTKKSLFFEPQWKDVWKTRLQRSEPTSALKDEKWVEFYDPRLKNKFYYNRFSDRFISESKNVLPEINLGYTT